MSANPALPTDSSIEVTTKRTHIVHPAYQFLWIWRLMLYGGLAAAAALGGPLLQLMAIVGGVIGLLMDWDGLFRHIFRWAALIGCVVATPVLAPMVATQLPANWSGPGAFSIPVEAWITFTGLFAVATILVGFVFRQVRKRPWLNMLNHVGGGTLGATEGALAVVTLYWGLSTFADTLHALESSWAGNQADPTVEVSPLNPALDGVVNYLPGELGGRGPMGFAQLSRLHAYLASDPLAPQLDQHNVFEKIPAVKGISQLTALAADKDAVEAISKNPSLTRFAYREDVQSRLRALASDPKIRDALSARDFKAMLRSGALRQIVGDAELLRIAQEALPELKQALEQTGQPRLSAEAANLTPQKLAELQRSALNVIAAAEAGNRMMAETLMREQGIDEQDLKELSSTAKSVRPEVEAALTGQSSQR
jgi:hypothetical protein